MILSLSLVVLIILSLLGATVSIRFARAQDTGPDARLTAQTVVQGQTVTYTGSGVTPNGAQSSDLFVILNNPAAVQDSNVIYNGNGFTPSGTVDLTIESGYTTYVGSVWYNLGSVSASLTGSIHGQFQVGENIVPGTRQVIFTDESTNEKYTTPLAVFEFVQFLTNPTSFPGSTSGNILSSTCGGLVAGQTSPTCGPNFSAAAVLPNPSTGWRFDHWETDGNKTHEPGETGDGWGISCFPLNTNSTKCSGFSAGVLTAFFSAAITIITDPTYVGSVSFESCSGFDYTDGSVVWRPELSPNFTNVPVCANGPIPDGFVFAGWTSTGGISVANPLSPATTLQLTGPGTLTAHYGVPISLQPGWNLISLPVVPTDSSPKSVLGSLIAANEVSIVWGYSASTKAWQSFTPPSTGSLATMVDGAGYWVYMKSAATLYVGGAVIPNTQTPPAYPLVSGWNLIGFKPQPTVGPETVSAYLSGISGKYDPNNVWIYDNVSASWIRANSSFVLQPGQAIWILITSAATFKP